eukprot:TRINITY_DN5044_c0_g1_i2.p1 TRINITY_DN5044_c0_g1~~TRINITY_DN5044_c0_g1_i2.p1  ORF type:complete len:874 (-),score=197.94 TRINITY_DN5044_c0_g1_i2:11-2632(-)
MLSHMLAQNALLTKPSKTFLKRKTVSSKKYSQISNDSTSSGYNHIEIEHKWQTAWKALDKMKSLKRNSGKKKKYVLSMFPYPSGTLHIGHARVYTISDAMARYNKMLGYEVLHPMGWDSFGLPAENAAIERGVSPVDWTFSNIEDMRNQFLKFGADFDWSESELYTCREDYYKWTQWLFLELYKTGLAYQKYSYVNWDPVDNTVLANEQVDAEGRSWRSGAIVEKKELKQWYFKLTQFADSLLKDLDKLKDWPNKVKLMQKEWIGKKEGASITFQIDGSDRRITVFTTRADTLYGVSYLVLAPENPLVHEIVSDSCRDEVLKYIEEGLKKREIDRQQSKTGVALGINAIHPLTMDRIPIYISEYVLSDFGTGAVMGVPAHDTRDFEFAKLFDLPIKQVIESEEECSTDQGILKNSAIYSGMHSKDAVPKIIEHAKRENFGDFDSVFSVRDWLISRQRFWGAPIPMIHCDNCGTVPVPQEDLPVKLPEVTEFTRKGPTIPEDWINTTCPCCGGAAKRDTDTMDTFVDSSWYFLRYPDAKNETEIFSKDKLEGNFPVDTYIGGIEHAILHLLYSRFITKVLNHVGLLDHNEPFKQLITQGMVHGKTFRIPGNQRCVKPHEVEEKGESAFLKETGEELEITWEKMSKSKYNGVDPLEIIKEFGADTMRLFLLFKAPIESVLDWDTSAIKGQARWINRVIALVEGMTSTKNDHSKEKQSELKKFSNDILVKVTQDIQQLQFNTTIAHLMKLSNKLKEMEDIVDTPEYEKTVVLLLTLLYPMAPHICSELLEKISGVPFEAESLLWPKAEVIKETNKKLVFRVNGKVKGSLEIPLDQTEESQILSFLKSDKKYGKFVTEEFNLERYEKADVINFIKKN